MAEDSNKVVIEVVLDDGSIAKGFANIKSEGDKTASSLSKAFGINGLADLTAGLFLVKKAFDVFKDSVTAGIQESLEAERISLQLATAIKSVPGATDAAVASFKEFSSALSAQIAIDDDVINSSAKLLASLGRLSGEGLQNATRAAADFAAGTGKDLESASFALAKAAEGNVTAFQKLGFTFTKGASDGQLLKETLDQINSRFQGLAQNLAANTFEGVLNRLKVAFDDSNQALGDFITKSPVIREILKIIAESFERSTEFLKSFQGQKFLDDLIIRFFEFAKGVTDYLIRPLEAFYNIGRFIFQGVVVSVNALIAGIADLGGAIGFVLSKLGNKGIAESLMTFRESAVATFQDSAKAFAEFGDVTKTPFSETIYNGLDGITTRLNSVKESSTLASAGITAVNASINESIPKINEGIIANQNFASTFDAVAAALLAVKNNMKTAALEIGISAKQISTTVINGIGNATAGAFSAFGKAIVEGTNALDAFVNSLLGSLGQMAVQVGSQFILQGIAYSLAGLPNGPALIGAGAALATFGGVLSAIGGRSASPAGVSSGSGTAGVDITSPGAGSDSPINDAVETRQVRPEVVVNVNGDILGDEGSGNRLISLLNSAFDTSGVNLREGIV